MVVAAQSEPRPADGAFDVTSLKDPAARRSLSAPAFRLFVNTANLWGLSVDQRLTLLGDIARQTYHKWAAGDVGTMSRDQIERVSLVLGILKGLRLLFADDASALRWLKSPNRDIPFAGKSPLDRMLRGGIEDLYTVRRYLDAWRGVR